MKKVQRTLDDYRDILAMPRHVSASRPKMATGDRAAQFAPFAGVVGHEAAIREAARYTDEKKELDEMEKAIIDERLREVEAKLPGRPEVELVYFEPDAKKAGGHYITRRGRVKKLDAYERTLVFEDGTWIAVEDLFGVRQVE